MQVIYNKILLKIDVIKKKIDINELLLKKHLPCKD